MHFSTLSWAAAFAPLTLAGYVLEDDYMSDFYGNFDFFTGGDPTNGFVQYVDQTTAQSMNLINASTTSSVGWGVDTTTKDEAGRASVRLTSKKSYNKGLVVVDVQHMPFGCGTWPAFWMVGPSWPNAGEIDILEGVNEQDTNAITLHTGPGCSVGSDTNAFAGTVSTTNCDVKAEGQAENAGCSIKQKETTSYGAGLNNGGGGVYATEWTSDAINVYFFARDSIPTDVLGDAPNPSTWGTPAASFANSGCDIDSIFKDQQIVFDTTFCGEWAGNVWESGSCASKAPTCNDYVRDNPEAFTDAFWTINALKVYQSGGAAAPAPSVPATSPKSTAAPKPISSATKVPTVVSTITPTKVSSKVPVVTSSTFKSPPIVDPSQAPGLPSSTDIATPPAPSAPATSARPWGGKSRTWGGGHRGRPTQIPQAQAEAPSVAVAAADDGSMGGFTWPGAGAGTKPAATPTSRLAPFPARNSTVPILPTGTGTLNATAIIPSVTLSTANAESATPIDLSTVPSFAAKLPPGVSSAAVPSLSVSSLEAMPAFGDAASTPLPSVADADPVVTETVYATLTVTMGSNETPAAAPSGYKLARHAREHRRRMAQHNGRK